ncbi:MAG: class I SAM-dependent methyltransferase [Oscillospiraceae bacterium]|jgi:hypothetical protein|nr:class I SAM-dependent methyltransferase [Oscillospiraceae bacterium]
MGLYKDFRDNPNRMVDKWMHYFPVYEKHFGRFVNQSVNFWEIGVCMGGSVQMWDRYFGPFAQIIGIDILPECKQFENGNIHIEIGDQKDTEFLEFLVDKYGPPDIVLDDGSHIMSDACQTFDFLYPKVSKNGVYMVEDMHTAYMSGIYEGGLKEPGSFIEKSKDLVDSMNRFSGLPTAFADTIFEIAFYESIVCFEKIKWHNNFRSLHTAGNFNITTTNENIWGNVVGTATTHAPGGMATLETVPIKP